MRLADKSLSIDSNNAQIDIVCSTSRGHGASKPSTWKPKVTLLSFTMAPLGEWKKLNALFHIKLN